MSHTISIVPVNGDRGILRLESRLKAQGVQAELSATSTLLPHYLLKNGVSLADSFSAASTGCSCMTACPVGYEDVNGSCLKPCPAGFSGDSDSSSCYGNYNPDVYFAWEMDKCESEHPDVGCGQRGLYIEELCKANYSYGVVGCFADCEAHGLDRQWDKDILMNSCAKPKAERTKTGRSDNNQCVAGSVPSNDCSRVDISYSLSRIELGSQ